MSNFFEEIYSQRTNLGAFCARLITHLNHQWTEVVRLAGMDVMTPRPGFIQRCRTVGSGQVVCNYAPTSTDIMRIRALLKAWSREINDRYLNLELLRRFENSRYADISTAFNTIKKNDSLGGAVSFIRDNLLAERNQNGTPAFFGQQMFNNYDYNTYYTLLLNWDDFHCYGVIRELEMQAARTSGMGGSALHPIWRAARNWLSENTGVGVYKEYQLTPFDPFW